MVPNFINNNMDSENCYFCTHNSKEQTRKINAWKVPTMKFFHLNKGQCAPYLSPIQINWIQFRAC